MQHHFAKWTDRVSSQLPEDWQLRAHRYGVPEPYEKLKAFTRGVAVTQASMQVRLHGLERVALHCSRGAQAQCLAVVARGLFHSSLLKLRPTQHTGRTEVCG